MDEPLLAINEIQGNILPGFGRPLQTLVGLRFTEATAARALLRDLLPKISSLRIVYEHRLERKEFFATGTPAPQYLNARWLNVALSVDGLRLLGEEAIADLDTAFRVGMAARSRSLGDPANPEREDGTPNPGHKSHWIVGGPHNTADALVLLAADKVEDLDKEEAWLWERIARVRAGVNRLYTERGKALPDSKEHFGFRDDISHPGVRGLIRADPPEYLSTRYLKSQLPGGPEFSRPGQPLVWPGQFILGYPPQSQVKPMEPGLTPVDLPPLAANGSFMVFRRLQQDVSGFYATTDALAEELAAKPGWQHLTGALLRALLVGRWPSGLPLLRSPQRDDLEQARNRFALNHFTFGEDSPKLQLVTGETIAGAPADRDGFLCPHIAHVRKVNPRDRDTDQGAAVVTLSLRILRRGIPFGTAYNHTDPSDPKNVEPRGLLFLSYQASIERQFEVLNNKWMNNPAAPESDDGVDLLVGQRGGSGAGGNRDRSALLRRADSSIEAVVALSDWVFPTGGGYFFAPSVSALRALAEA